MTIVHVSSFINQRFRVLSTTQRIDYFGARVSTLKERVILCNVFRKNASLSSSQLGQSPMASLEGGGADRPG